MNDASRQVQTLPQLQQEIIESQRIRADLLKWKIILVAVLGGIGLGVSEPNGTGPVANADWLLGGIPFVCVYVDSILRHIALRNSDIGRYRETRPADPYSEYQQFVAAVRKKQILDLESLASIVASIAFSILVCLTPWIAFDGSWTKCAAISSCGLIGIALSYALERRFRKLLKRLKKLPAAPPADATRTDGA